jgi:hypothetical protein
MNFIELISRGGGGAGNKPVFVAGSGLSYGLVPMPGQLLMKLVAERADIESRLGCATAVALTGTDVSELYTWAEQAFECLKAHGHPTPKLAIADALGVTRDPAWQGKIGVPLRGSAPRHRVIARLAREDKWNAIWSFNWDCVLETALEAVGMPPKPPTPSPRKLPWREWHLAWTHPEPIPVDDDGAVIVVKPHGCVRKLISGGVQTFLITRQELQAVQVNAVSAYGTKHFTGQPLVGCGWSASESYVIGLLTQIADAGALGNHDPDCTLHVIDPKLSDGHRKLIELYKANAGACATAIEITGCPKADQFFLWVQSRHGLSQLAAASTDHAAELNSIATGALSSPGDHWINEFFDTFLPTWSLFCFRAGFTTFYVNAVAVGQAAIPPDRDDEHVPLSFQNVPRDDLVSAARLLLHLFSRGGDWNFGSLPGAIWRASTRTVFIPVPNWRPTRSPNWLAYEQMMKRHRWLVKHRIEKVTLLLINSTDNLPEAAANTIASRRVIAGAAPTVEWSNEANLVSQPLDSL